MRRAGRRNPVPRIFVAPPTDSRSRKRTTNNNLSTDTLRPVRLPQGICTFSPGKRRAHPSRALNRPAPAARGRCRASAALRGSLLALLGALPRKPLVLAVRGGAGRRLLSAARASGRPGSNGPRRRRPLLTSRYPPWCWRHARRPGPRRDGPGAAGQRPGGSPSASPRVGRDRITQAQRGAAGSRPAGRARG